MCPFLFLYAVRRAEGAPAYFFRRGKSFLPQRLNFRLISSDRTLFVSAPMEI